MSFAHIRPAAVVTVLVMAWLVSPTFGAQVDNINGSATPPFVNYAGPRDIGWYYTPALSYDLTGIFTTFRSVPNGTGSRTVTVQIQSQRPANGGTVLGQGSFTADSGVGGNLGASFDRVNEYVGIEIKSAFSHPPRLADGATRRLFLRESETAAGVTRRFPQALRAFAERLLPRRSSR